MDRGQPRSPLAYISRGMHAVDGWLHPVSARAIALLGRGGNGAEIGVHHGKLFVLISLLCEKAYAIDVFDSALNRDQSGDGDRSIFERNLQRHGGSYSVIQADSASVSPSQLPPIRLFSVDGSHTADMTESDLRLASAALEPDGVIVLDDYFNQYWPDVSIGANRVIGEGSIAPFAITPGKLLLTKGDPTPYLQILAESPSFHSYREMAGHRVALLTDRRQVFLRRVLDSALYRRVRAQRWATPLKRLGRKVLG